MSNDIHEMDLLSCAEFCTDCSIKKMSTIQQSIPSFQNNDVETTLQAQAFEQNTHKALFWAAENAERQKHSLYLSPITHKYIHCYLLTVQQVMYKKC